MAAEYKEFWLTGSKYIKQVGDIGERLVVASPNSPVRVRLPADTVISDEDRIMFPVDDENEVDGPEKPKPHYAEKDIERPPNADVHVLQTAKSPEADEAQEAKLKFREKQAADKRKKRAAAKAVATKQRNSTRAADQ